MPEQFNFEESFPAITEWVHSHGWIEIGQTDEEQSFIRAIDEGGLVWEGKSGYPSLDHAIRSLENVLKKWEADNG